MDGSVGVNWEALYNRERIRAQRWKIHALGVLLGFLLDRVLTRLWPL
jgi:hypothetical protein